MLKTQLKIPAHPESFRHPGLLCQRGGQNFGSAFQQVRIIFNLEVYFFLIIVCKQIRTVPKIYIYDIIDSQLQEVVKNANVKLLYSYF